MRKNVGLLDKSIRLLVALAITVLYVGRIISGMTATVFLILAVVLAATSVLSFCPIYKMIGLKTCRKCAL